MNVGYVVARAARQYADNICVVDGDTRLTFRQVNERMNRLANGLLGIGLQKGDRVAILMGNCAHCVEVDYGLAKAGLVRLPLNARSSVKEHTEAINDAEAKAFIIGSDFIEHVGPMIEQIPTVQHFIYVSGGSGVGLDYESLLARSSAEEPLVDVDEEDLFTLQYTSGTTGKARAVMWPHRMPLTSMVNYLGEIGSIREDSAVLHVAPMTHSAGVFMLPHFAKGARQVVLKRFDPQEVCETIERDRITFAVFVPTMIYMLLALPNVRKYDYSTLRTILCVAAPISVEKLREAIDVFGHVFGQGYGLSEGMPPVAHMGPEDYSIGSSTERRIASCGRPAMGVEVKVVDDDGNEVKPGEIGQITCRGRNMMKGYWKKPEETTRAIRNGWLYTRDMATVDEHGFIYIVDRKDDLIISGGFNVYPREVEEVLFAHPLVHEAAVIPVPDNKWGEAIKAVVVLKAGATATEQELIDYCGARLTGYKKPKSIEFVHEIPKSANGKVSRRAIREKYWQGFERQVH